MPQGKSEKMSLFDKTVLLVRSWNRLRSEALAGPMHRMRSVTQDFEHFVRRNASGGNETAQVLVDCEEFLRLRGSGLEPGGDVTLGYLRDALDLAWDNDIKQFSNSEEVRDAHAHQNRLRRLFGFEAISGAELRTIVVFAETEAAVD